MTAEARSAPLRWPDKDTLLASFQKDAELVEVTSPIFTPTELDADHDGSASYIRVCPKLEIHAFHSATWAPKTGPLHLLGAVYFSKATAGAPGLVAGGALTTALDCICSEVSMREGGFELLYVTRSLSVNYLRFVEVDAVCRFDCRAEPFENGKRVHCSLSTTSSVQTECVCIMLPARSMPPSAAERMRLRAQARRIPTQLVMTVPGSDEGWWPAAAREVAARVLREEPGLEPAAEHMQRFPMTDAMAAGYAGQTYWDLAPDATTFFWDVGREGAAARCLAGSAPKIVWQMFWRGGQDTGPGIVCIVLFTANSRGPPARAHGGAVATVFDWGTGILCVRQFGFLPAWNNVNLSVEYLRPTPLGEPLVLVARLTKREGRLAQVEAVLLPADRWSARNEDMWAAEHEGVLARGWSDLKQARPASVGLEAPLSYEEALERFGGEGPLESFQKAQVQVWQKQAKL